MRLLKIISVGGSLAVIIPARWCRELAIKRDTYLDATFDGPNGTVTLERIDNGPRIRRESQLDINPS